MDGWYRCPSRPPSLSCGRVQARGAPANIHACAVGLMEARGTTRFAHGSTCTDWKPWKRIECTELFPDVMRDLFMINRKFAGGRLPKSRTHSMPVSRSGFKLHKPISNLPCSISPCEKITCTATDIYRCGYGTKCLVWCKKSYIPSEQASGPLEVLDGNTLHCADPISAVFCG